MQRVLSLRTSESRLAQQAELVGDKLSRGAIHLASPGSRNISPTVCMATATSTPAKVQRVPHASLHVSKPVYWLESRFHFSFADYWDPERQNFGALRVMNDDLVKAHDGFGRHPHRDAEIFSYIVDGQLSHQDSMGNKEALGRGSVQYMSAGTGVTHSEMNDGDETCRFIQVWLTPDKKSHAPQYGSSTYQKTDRHNRLLHMLGGSSAPPQWPGVRAPHAIKLHQDANVYVSESDAGTAFDLSLGPDRQAYLLVIEGSADVNGVQLGTQDGARILGKPGAPSPLAIKAGDKGMHVLMVEMATSD